jgi:hypothetical protein
MEASTEQGLTIEERLAELYAEMDVIIDQFIADRAAACIGVPRGSIENSYLARAHGCRCEEYRVVRQLIKTAEELARKQQVDCALPTGE